MDILTLEKRRESVRRKCRERGLTIRPYGNAHWIVGNRVSLIVSDLAFVAERDLQPMPVIER